MNLIQLAAGDARPMFSDLYAQILERTHGLGVTGIRIDAFFDDQFVITDHANFDKVPLPRHIRFEHDTTYIINAPCLPNMIEARELTLDRPTEADTIRWDASAIQHVVCSVLTLVDPSIFPQTIEADQIKIEYSEDARDEGEPDFSNCRIILREPDFWAHKEFLLLLGSLSAARSLGLECLIGGFQLHAWANQSDVLAARQSCTAEEQADITTAVITYETAYKTRAAAKAVLTAVPLPTGMIIEVDLA